MSQQRSERPERNTNSDSEAETAAIVAAQAGDRTAFVTVIQKYWDPLFRWLYHLTGDRHQAEDLTQETFLKALSGIRSFKAGSNFRAWLFRIGHNNFVNLKRTTRRETVAVTNETPAAGPNDVASNTAADKEILERVHKAIAALPHDFRAALLLRAEEGLSFKEVATVMKITEETARWRVFKARQRVMQILGPDSLPDGLIEESN